MIVAYVHCVIVIYFPEVYPTNIRLIGVGFVNLMGRIGEFLLVILKINGLKEIFMPRGLLNIAGIGSGAQWCVLGL